jgi:isoquinoline 1-oxidoreductase alpha subunit
MALHRRIKTDATVHPIMAHQRGGGRLVNSGRVWLVVERCCPVIDSVGTSEITTIEAIGATPAGGKIQKAWLDREVVQCGYCQSGQIMSASALLASNPHPTDTDIDAAMSGNICRCGTYLRIREAIKQAAQ